MQPDNDATIRAALPITRRTFVARNSAVLAFGVGSSALLLTSCKKSGSSGSDYWIKLLGLKSRNLGGTPHLMELSVTFKWVNTTGVNRDFTILGRTFSLGAASEPGTQRTENWQTGYESPKTLDDDCAGIHFSGDFTTGLDGEWNIHMEDGQFI